MPAHDDRTRAAAARPPRGCRWHGGRPFGRFERSLTKGDRPDPCAQVRTPARRGSDFRPPMCKAGSCRPAGAPRLAGCSALRCGALPCRHTRGLARHGWAYAGSGATRVGSGPSRTEPDPSRVEPDPAVPHPGMPGSERGRPRRRDSHRRHGEGATQARQSPLHVPPRPAALPSCCRALPNAHSFVVGGYPPEPPLGRYAGYDTVGVRLDMSGVRLDTAGARPHPCRARPRSCPDPARVPRHCGPPEGSKPASKQLPLRTLGSRPLRRGQACLRW